MESLLWEQFGFDLAVPEKIVFLQVFLGAFKHTASSEARSPCLPWSCGPAPSYILGGLNLPGRAPLQPDPCD